MKTRLLITCAAAATVATASACTSQAPDEDAFVAPPWVPVSAQLAAFDSCDDALAGIQDAAITAFSNWEPNELLRSDEEFAADSGAASTESQPQAASDDAFSGTNNAVAGVDEPDIVKTDGTFIYSVVDYDAVRVVDTRSGEVVAERAIADEAWDHKLFLGDDELLLMSALSVEDGDEYVSEFRLERLDPASLDVLDTFTMEGSMVDARLVDGEVRLAIGSQPQIQPVWEQLWSGDVSDDDIAEAVRDTELSDWLPSYEVNGEAHEVDCAEIAHPERFTGASVSVLALPADGDWTEASPQTVMVDGSTVHGTTDSLYLAHYDYAWGEDETNAESEIYRFVFADGKARLAGEAAVPGTLLNQYSLSEYDGHLRVATTEQASGGNCGVWNDCAWEVAPDEPSEPSKSTVTVFAVGDDALEETGSVTDLGVDEQIYAVRFIGDTGYVVTFRQTDPLYTIDLSDPANPVVTGELKITGYSGYLHPVGPDRLLGVGQEATAEGQTTGLQVSLFDTAASEATMLDQYHREGADSAVQWDPHAFLYWEDAAIAVIPVSDWDMEYGSGVVVLDVGADTLTEAAWIDHSDAGADPYNTQVLRTLVIGDQLWTLSNAGLQANHLGGDYASTAWVGWQ
ncbi:MULTISPECIES: beta-propeller domain-containing protein [Glycomyces]|uniref:Beta-propeller domain-containing protein n=2 Tax=Glycomyces TaxID=58113 RepID=A0A9X3PRM1_9ACTN|nr:beta-propeller domain-containing protein [Glycomyces lechevalierae]MDA1388057.1 beta-propeller domain-containing protein [Glycomyces lechevalierae]MDR7338771.1 putative secreted protein with C-terminal beta-propeller domain [Glycomyces lechevalierae]